MVQSIPPQEAAQFRSLVLDVREWPEYAAGAIEGSLLVPLGRLAREVQDWGRQKPILLVCRSGRRAERAAATLDQLGFENVNVLTGGIEAWRAQGLPLQASSSKPWSLERQVRAIAGTLVLGFTVLALTVSPGFLAGTLFVGAGLLFAGITDLCLMAALLGKLPWNRAAEFGCSADSQRSFEK